MMISMLFFWLIWRRHIPASDLHDPGQDSSPALGIPFPICFWQGVWGYVSLFAHNGKRSSRGHDVMDRGHDVLIHPSESWCEPFVTVRLFKIISTFGYTESWEVALANPQHSSPHQTDVLFCSQLCCLKKFLLSARKGWGICSLDGLCVRLIKPPSPAGYFFSSIWDEAVAGKNRLFLIQKTKRERKKGRKKAEKENGDKHVKAVGVLML